MVIHPSDNVEIHDDGHKYARRAIAAGEAVVKYGMPIGHATRDIAPGEHVHVHNLATNLGDVLEYRYEPDFADLPRQPAPEIMAYRHPDGRIGILPGGGITPKNARAILEATGCTELHASASIKIEGRKVTSAALVSAINAILQ